MCGLEHNLLNVAAAATAAHQQQQQHGRRIPSSSVTAATANPQLTRPMNTIMSLPLMALARAAALKTHLFREF